MCRTLTTPLQFSPLPDLLFTSCRSAHFPCASNLFTLNKTCGYLDHGQVIFIFIFLFLNTYLPCM